MRVFISSIRTALFALVWALGMIAVDGQNVVHALDRPEIYFYGPPVIQADGTAISSPLSVSLEQMTSAFPNIPEMDGVVLVLTWAQLEPAEGQYDFDLLDKTIAYWKAKGKKLAFGISTAGPMVRTISEKGPYFRNHAPDWLLSKVAVYSAPDGTIGVIGKPGPVETIFPSYWDPTFVGYFKKLISAVAAHLNNEKSLAYVRISPGIVGEDEPSPFGVDASKMPGFTCSKWVDYNYEITRAYLKNFRHGNLEYDLSYLPWCYAGHSGADKAKVDGFVDYLIQNRIFIAFNGLQSQLLTWAGNSERGSFSLNRLAHYLFLAKSHGLSVGLEAIGPMFVPKMQDKKSTAAAIKMIKPTRLVFFGMDAAGLNFLREGKTGGNEASLVWVRRDEQRLRQFGLDLSELLEDIK